MVMRVVLVAFLVAVSCLMANVPAFAKVDHWYRHSAHHDTPTRHHEAGLHRELKSGNRVRTGITVGIAAIQAGELVIAGYTPGARAAVSAEDRFNTISNRAGRFTFHLAYHPHDCTVTLKSGNSERKAVIASCAAGGSQGEPGQTGATGPAGVSGSEGAQGAQGARGSEGPQGPAGLRGEAGIAGPQGAQGAAGPQGPAGSRGEPGIAGPQGAPGAAGPQGPAGPRGEAGIAGPQGAQGAAGPQGPAGPRGEAGIAGAQGAPGSAGPQGPAGPPGEAAAAGLRGDAGPPGPRGEAGTAAGQIRRVRQACSAGQICAVSCDQNETALNALCPKQAPATLTGDRSVSCGIGNSDAMVAYCVSH
jgi:Collagen triple helix repeat (20 copies)